jgi:hypothetical protein
MLIENVTMLGLRCMLNKTVTMLEVWCMLIKTVSMLELWFMLTKTVTMLELWCMLIKTVTMLELWCMLIKTVTIKVITKLPNSKQSYKGKVKTHNYINRQNSQQPENCENSNDPDLVQAFLKKWWVESDFKAPNLPLLLRFKGSGCHCNSI